ASATPRRGRPAGVRGRRRRGERGGARTRGARGEGARRGLSRALADGLRARRRPGVPGRCGPATHPRRVRADGVHRAGRGAGRGRRQALHRNAAHRRRPSRRRLPQVASRRRGGGSLQPGRRAGRHGGRRVAAGDGHLQGHGRRGPHGRDGRARCGPVRGGRGAPARGARGAGRPWAPDRRGVPLVRRLRELRRPDGWRLRGHRGHVDHLGAGRRCDRASRRLTRRGRARRAAPRRPITRRSRHTCRSRAASTRPRARTPGSRV
ncbi:MAG: Hydrolase, carbon-nitrogen family, partial [uncultured Gemmatimonadaceae bacterium]